MNTAVLIFAVLQIAVVSLAPVDGEQDPRDVYQVIRKNRSAFQCTPNTKFKLDCNTCYCHTDGKGASCTTIGCLRRKRRATKCTPGEVFKRDCNTCRCAPDGMSEACTKISCRRGQH